MLSTACNDRRDIANGKSDNRRVVSRLSLGLRVASFNRRRIAHDRNGARGIGENLAGD